VPVDWYQASLYYSSSPVGTDEHTQLGYSSLNQGSKAEQISWYCIARCQHSSSGYVKTKWITEFRNACLITYLLLKDCWPHLQQMSIFLYYLPFGSISSLSALVNHFLHLPVISVWTFPLLFYRPAYFQKFSQPLLFIHGYSHVATNNTKRPHAYSLCVQYEEGQKRCKEGRIKNSKEKLQKETAVLCLLYNWGSETDNIHWAYSNI
jgi:hypothetical protein